MSRDIETNELVKAADKKPGRKYRWAMEPDGVEIVTKKKIDEDFDKKWNDTMLPKLKSEYARDIAKIYADKNAENKVTRAEAFDKIHFIQVERTGYRLQGDSYKVMKVEVFKKVEEVTK